MEDLQKLISEVTETFKPQYDHRKLKDEVLLALYAVYTIQGCQVIVRTLHMKGRAPFTSETAKRASGISHDPSPENLAWLYSYQPDPRPLRFLVWLKVTRRRILEELAKRHKKFKAGVTFIQMDEHKWQGELNDLHKAIGVERITSYRPQKEDPEDLRSVATTKAVEFFKRRGETIQVKQRPGMPIPPLPQDLGLPPRDPDPWGLWHRYQLDIYIENLMKDYLSLFFGRVDRVKEAAHQGLRNLWEKWEAKKRSGEEVLYEDAEREIRSRQFKEWLEEEREEGTPDVSAKMFEVLRVARKRWGGKAVRALVLLQQGKTQEEAAKLTKIPYQSLRRYLSKLRKEFSKKS